MIYSTGLTLDGASVSVYLLSFATRWLQMAYIQKLPVEGPLLVISQGQRNSAWIS